MSVVQKGAHDLSVWDLPADMWDLIVDLGARLRAAPYAPCEKNACTGISPQYRSWGL